MNAKVCDMPLMEDEAAAEVGVSEYTSDCPNGCGWRLLAQWQPAREFYLLFTMLPAGGVYDDDGIGYEVAGRLESVQVMAKDKLRSHLKGCGDRSLLSDGMFAGNC